MTYSIVARDPDTGAMGVAVQSHYFATGRVVTWAEAGVGAVATQSFVEVGYGPRGLEAMRAGATAPIALERLLAEDPMPAVRQVAMLDAGGQVAVHTGARCIAMAGHRTDEQVSAQANMMARATVWEAMVAAYRASAAPDLAGRLLDALDAAEAEGGDIRGRQSAALLVVDGERSDRPWEHRLVDLRVDDHPQPLAELRRLLECDRAVRLMARTLDRVRSLGRLDGASPEVAEALAALETAQRALGENREPTFWAAVVLAGAGRLDEARSRLREAAAGNPGWVELLTRLPAAGLIPRDDELLGRLLGDGA
ncbi:MAG TPA: DUF1028 domain-containing protein [Candidatus Dormibacteraeota bacterium]|jgi:uncharacterized Ntn-hydrolase superfamily protein|nr:DUF1028 domain-containing protein [Candidatus Dormibacteraeota bacterium]